MRTLWRIGAALLLAAVSSAATAKPPATALLGSWVFDPAASRFDGGIPYQSGTLRFEAAAGGIHVVAHIVEGNGRLLHFEYVDAGDGAIARVDGNPFYDGETTRWRRNGAERTERRSGAVIGVTNMQVATDGRSFTARADRTRPDGRRYISVIVWKRAS
jgi:hypothetical protein